MGWTTIFALERPPPRWCRYSQRSRRVALMGRSATWLLPGMAFGRFRGTFRLSTRQCFGVTKFSPRGVVDLHAEKF